MVRRAIHQTRLVEAGFTMVELLMTMALASLLLGTVYSAITLSRVDEIDRQIEGVTAAQMARIAEAAQVFTLDNSGAWPDEVNLCVGDFAVLSAGGYVGGLSGASPLGASYTTACTTGNSGQFSVTIDTGDTVAAGTIANALTDGVAAGSSVTASWPLPAAIPALDALLPLDGSRAMTGDFDAGGHYLLNATDVLTTTGQSLAGAVQNLTTIDPSGTVAKPTCPTGMSPDAFVTGFPIRSLPSSGALYSLGASRVDLGASWRFDVTAVGPSGPETVTGSYVRVTVATQCI